jgi:hypothetical protein
LDFWRADAGLDRLCALGPSERGMTIAREAGSVENPKEQTPAG